MSDIKRNNGFTIVELLIVIVVIAILAAISIVAYNGMQQRARETAMKTDLSNAAKKIRIYQIDNSKYPNTANIGEQVGVRFSYSPVIANAILCANNANQDAGFAIVARDPKVGQWYKWQSTDSVAEKVAPSSGSAADLCATTPYPALLWGTHWVVGG